MKHPSSQGDTIQSEQSYHCKHNKQPLISAPLETAQVNDTCRLEIT